jgi:hypothetical protein
MAIPEQIRRQSEAIAKHYAQADTQSETVEDTVATEQEGVGASGSEQADSVENTAPESASNEQRRPDTKEEETFEKRYKTLQGMYNADTTRLRAENQQINQRVAQLEQLLASLSESAAKPQQTATKLVTEKDIEEYGDSIEVMRRVTEESLSARDNRIAELEQMIRQMQTSVIPRVEQVAHKQAVSSEQMFWSELTAAVPNWRDINADQNFLNWLMEVDPLTGMSRQTYLEDAQRNLDTRRVVNFFSAWQGNVGQSVAQSPRDAVASELDRQVAPGRSRGGGAPSKDQSKTYAPKDIQKFFDDVRKGVYRGKEAERDRIERDIFAAQRENRIVANG